MIILIISTAKKPYRTSIAMTPDQNIGSVVKAVFILAAPLVSPDCILKSIRIQIYALVVMQRMARYADGSSMGYMGTIREGQALESYYIAREGNTTEA
ncbi:hypothetical protein ABVK25_009863 [Lepraria finkii]|uniref:Uncharacterized protein n=1 Tax=Lepraria finkii TaxID=1340010 RepID=A0ABR4AZ23_9LECA